MYHPELGREIEAASPEQEAIYAASGWVPAPDPPAARPGFEAEPTTYVQGENGLYVPESASEPEAAPEPPAKPSRARKAPETD